MAVEDELKLEFQGEDSTLSSTAAKVVQEINTLDNAITNLISKFNNFSTASSSAESNISNFINATNGIEEISNKVDKLSQSFTTMNPNVEKASEVMNSFKGTSDSISDLEKKVSQNETQIRQNNQALEEAKNKTDNLKNSNKKLAESYNVIAGIVGTVYNRLKTWTLQAAEATRTQTRFNAVFDKNNGELKEAQQWVDKYSNALLLDNIQVENAVSRFRVLTNTMGINNEKSKEMSFNMTQLAYDLSAVSGNDVSQTINQITSALGGQTKALNEYGISIDNNILQQYLNAKGIDRKVKSLTAAEKAEVRYMQIMQSSAGMQGYYAKTLMSPANAANIIKTQFSLLAREIGNVFIPVLMALVPIVVAVTKALRSLAQMLASFLGISVDFDDYSDGLSLMSAGIDDVGNSADGTSKKVKNMLRDFDDLHVVDFGKNTSSGAGGGAGGGIGGGKSLFDKQEYADYNSLLDTINDKLKILEKILLAVGAAILGWKLGKLIGNFLSLIGVLDKAKIGILALGTALASAGLYLVFDANKDIRLEGLNKSNLIETIIGAILTGAGGALVALAFGASPMVALTIGLTIGISLIAINLLTGIAKGIMDKYHDEIEELKAKYGWYDEGTGLGKKILISIKIAGNINMLIFQDWLQQIEDWWNATTVEEKLKKIGSLIIQGIIRGGEIAIFGIPALIGMLFEKIVSSIMEIFDMHSPSKVMEEYGKNIILGLFNGIESLFIKINEIFINLKNNIIVRLDETKNNVIQKTEEIKNNVINKFTDMKNNTINKVNELKNNIFNKFNDIKSNITDKINSAKDNVKNAIDKIKGFFNFEWKLPDIKMPHFGIDWDTSGVAGQAFQKLGFPGLPNLRVDWYAGGGFPNKGDLFIANEREPELIGSMGNKSVVANNAQITEGIAKASYGAFKQALSEMGDSFGGDTLVYVGDTQLTDVITKKKNIQDKRFGR